MWVYRGSEYTEPPVEMIVDAILRRVYGGAAAPRADVLADYELPETLARVFAGRAAVPSPTQDACCR